jgi:hypothetical protein
MLCRLNRLGVPCSASWVIKLTPWVDAWNEAAQHVVAPTGPHTEASFLAYLRYYDRRTRSRVTFADMTPAPHQASTQDSYPHHRDEALAGAVSNFELLLKIISILT